MIPLVDDFLKLCIQPDFFDRFLQVSLVLSIAAMIYSTFRYIPYGKNYQRGKSLLKVEVRDRIAVILVNSPGPLIFLYSMVFYPNGDLFSLPSLLYLLHYAHRTLVYPWFRKNSSKPWPLESVIYFFASNFIVGLTFSHMLIFSGKKMNIYLQIALALGMIACACANAFYDYYTCSLRKAGDQGYQVPQHSLYKLISGPQYLFEFAEWLCYIFFIPFGFGFATAGIWIMANVTGRAEANHAAYTKRNIFPKGVKYPVGRAPYIPFVENSKYLI